MAKKRHPGSLDRRGDTFRVRLCVGGKYSSFTVETSERRVAERYAAQKYAELKQEHRRRVAGLPDAVRMSTLLDVFERQDMPMLAPGTQSSYHDSLKPIKTFFVTEQGDPSVASIRAGHITAYLTWRRTKRLNGAAPLHNRTLAKDRAVLHRLFTLADRLEYREGNPVARTDAPKADSRDPVLLSDAEYDGLINACSDRPMLQLYVVLLGETGMRCESEALHLRWEDVDLDAGFLWISSGRNGHRTKSGKGRWVPLSPVLDTALRDHFAMFRFAGSPWVFHHERTRRHHRAGERIKSLRDAFKNAATRAKLSAGLHQHDLRHRRATTLLAGGANPVHVKEMLGHSDLRTTMHYTHLSREHLRGLVTPAPRTETRDMRAISTA